MSHAMSRNASLDSEAIPAAQPETASLSRPNPEPDCCLGHVETGNTSLIESVAFLKAPNHLP